MEQIVEHGLVAAASQLGPDRGEVGVVARTVGGRLVSSFVWPSAYAVVTPLAGYYAHCTQGAYA